MTLGGEGCVAAVAAGVLRVPAFKVRVVDPTGAGDAFSAGVILMARGALDRGDKDGGFTAAAWQDVLVYASACGAVCATGIGTTTAVDRRKVEALVKRQGGGLSRAVRLVPAAQT